MISESQFNIIVNKYLEAISDELELKDNDMLIDADINEGVLTLELDNGKEYVISRNIAAKQLWLSSPISGGLHYDYNETSKTWESTKDGSFFDEILAKELYQLTSIELDFNK